MKYGYARVSTIDQKLESQIEKLKEGDTLIVTKLDRFVRNTKEALEIIQNLFKRNIKTYILNLGLIDNITTGQLVFTIFSAFAEFERTLIIEHTQEGNKYAKEHDINFCEGRPRKYNNEQIQLAYELKKQGLTYKMIERKTGISISTLQRAFRRLKVELDNK